MTMDFSRCLKAVARKLFQAAAMTLMPVALMAAEASTNSLPTSDAAGNPIRRAPTGHVSNYDEAKTGNYTLPDPLVTVMNQPVKTPEEWPSRRLEILNLFATQIYGQVPAYAPPVKFEVLESEVDALGGLAMRRKVLARFGTKPNGPKLTFTLFLPAKATGPVPVLLHATFGGVPANFNVADVRATDKATARREIGPVADILERGYGYAAFRYSEIQPDVRTNVLAGVRALGLAPYQNELAPFEWGSITAWAWGTSRVLDYLAGEPGVDAKRVALIGHSRLGKMALWAGAMDPRFAVIFSSCSGEMGASLYRRDYGETVDDMAANFPWQFAANFQRYAGKWNDLPVDAHMLIALNAPRPVFVTAGSKDQWADPRGQFLSLVEAGPVYRLLGRKDLGTKEMPALDTPLIEGDLGFHYHDGGHTITAADWIAFLKFTDKYFKKEK